MMAVWAHWLVDAARLAAQGTGKSVIAQPGWQNRGHGGMRLIEVVVGHHTATPESAPGDYPSLNVVTYGRAGLAGPLAHYGLGRSGNIYVIAAGQAYHAGASAYLGYVDLNDESIGIEAEDSGDGVWTDDQLFMYPRLVGAILHYLGRPSSHYASHRTVAVPKGRKPDPTGISDEWMRQQSDAARQEGFAVADFDHMQGVLDHLASRIYQSVVKMNHQIDGADNGGVGGGSVAPDGEALSLVQAVDDACYRIYTALALFEGTTVGGTENVKGKEQLKFVTAMKELIAKVDGIATAVTDLTAKVDQIATGNVDYAVLADATADEIDQRARDNDPSTGPTS